MRKNFVLLLLSISSISCIISSDQEIIFNSQGSSESATRRPVRRQREHEAQITEEYTQFKENIGPHTPPLPAYQRQRGNDLSNRLQHVTINRAVIAQDVVDDDLTPLLQSVGSIASVLGDDDNEEPILIPAFVQRQEQTRSDSHDSDVIQLCSQYHRQRLQSVTSDDDSLVSSTQNSDRSRLIVAGAHTQSPQPIEPWQRQLSVHNQYDDIVRELRLHRGFCTFSMYNNEYPNVVVKVMAAELFKNEQEEVFSEVSALLTEYLQQDTEQNRSRTVFVAPDQESRELFMIAFLDDNNEILLHDYIRYDEYKEGIKFFLELHLDATHWGDNYDSLLI